MKARFSTLAAAAALVVTGNASAIVHITNPDYVVVIVHEYSGSGETNFSGGFGMDFGDGTGPVGDNGSFQNVNTQPRTISCTTGSDGICRMPTGNVIGSRWPGEVVYATEIVQGFQMGSFGNLVRSGDTGLYAPVPSAQNPDPAKCIADICDVARKVQGDNNAIQYARIKGVSTGIKWGTTMVSGLIGAKFGGLIGGAVAGGGAYALVKEFNQDMLDALDQAMKTAVANEYAKCKKKCGG